MCVVYIGSGDDLSVTLVTNYDIDNYFHEGVYGRVVFVFIGGNLEEWGVMSDE